MRKVTAVWLIAILIFSSLQFLPYGVYAAPIDGLQLSTTMLSAGSAIGTSIGIITANHGWEFDPDMTFELTAWSGDEDNAFFAIDTDWKTLLSNFVPDCANPQDKGAGASNNTYTIHVEPTNNHILEEWQFLTITITGEWCSAENICSIDTIGICKWWSNNVWACSDASDCPDGECAPSAELKTAGRWVCSNDTKDAWSLCTFENPTECNWGSCFQEPQDCSPAIVECDPETVKMCWWGDDNGKICTTLDDCLNGKECLSYQEWIDLHGVPGICDWWNKCASDQDCIDSGDWTMCHMPECISVCGNSIKETTESCDDGNTTSGDGCSSSCTIESSSWWGWVCTDSPGVFVLVSKNSIWNSSEYYATFPTISAHGDFVAFVVTDWPEAWLWLYNKSTNATMFIDGTDSWRPYISPDGSSIYYKKWWSFNRYNTATQERNTIEWLESIEDRSTTTDGSLLAYTDTNDGQIKVRNMNTAEILTIGWWQKSNISSNGNYIVYENTRWEIELHSIQWFVLWELITTEAWSSPAVASNWNVVYKSSWWGLLWYYDAVANKHTILLNFNIENIDISDSGRYVSFASSESIDFADTNGTLDVYLHDVETNTTTLVSTKNTIQSESSIGDKSIAVISDDGNYLAMHGHNTSRFSNNQDAQVFMAWSPFTCLSNQSCDVATQKICFGGDNNGESCSDDAFCGEWVFGSESCKTSENAVVLWWASGICDDWVSKCNNNSDCTEWSICLLPTCSSVATICYDGWFKEYDDWVQNIFIWWLRIDGVEYLAHNAVQVTDDSSDEILGKEELLKSLIEEVFIDAGIQHTDLVVSFHDWSDGNTRQYIVSWVKLDAVYTINLLRGQNSMWPREYHKENNMIVQVPCDTDAMCGNWLREWSEQCDDSNTKDGDGCDSTCIIEKWYICDESWVECSDIDECKQKDVCGSNASCSNLPGSYACACEAWYTGDGILCTACSAWTYDAGDSCLACDSGSYSSTGATSCLVCISWYEVNSTQTACQLCQAWTYSTGWSSCLSCLAWSISESWATSCTPCEAGSYASGNNCLDCPTGTSSILGSTVCTIIEGIDTDEDGILDTDEWIDDTDGDGIPNNQDGDDDGDDVPTTVERWWPNEGDANNDGIKDYEQSDVATIPNSDRDSFYSLQVLSAASWCSAIQSFIATTEPLQIIQDATYSYPLWLNEFSIPCAWSVDIKLYYHEISSRNGYTYKKYGPRIPWDMNSIQRYNLADVTPVQYWFEMIDGKQVATISFTLTDGEAGDDTAVDGMIIDANGPGMVTALWGSRTSIDSTTNSTTWKPTSTTSWSWDTSIEQKESFVVSWTLVIQENNESCDETSYIQERYKKLSLLDDYIVYDIPQIYKKAISLVTKMRIESMRKRVKKLPIEKNHTSINRLVCVIEWMKQQRNLYHASIWYIAKGDAVDYLLQYLQDVFILQRKN